MSMDRLSKKINDHNWTINLPSHSNSRMASRKPSHCRMTTCVPIMCRPKFLSDVHLTWTFWLLVKKCLGNTALKKISTDHRAYINLPYFNNNNQPPTDRNTSENPRKVGAHLRVNDPIPRSWVFSPRHHQWVEAPVRTTAHSFRSSRVFFSRVFVGTFSSGGFLKRPPKIPGCCTDKTWMFTNLEWAHVPFFMLEKLCQPQKH